MFPSVLTIPLVAIVALAVLVIKYKLPIIEFLAVISGAVTGLLIGLVVTPEVSWGLAQMGAFIGSTLVIAILITAHAIKKLFSSGEIRVSVSQDKGNE